MFKFENGETTEINEGFSVHLIGRGKLRYKQGDKILFASFEFLTVEYDMVLYASSIKSWEPPYDSEKIDNKIRNTIIDNIRRVAVFNRFKLTVQ
jgi:hypothetical protein